MSEDVRVPMWCAECRQSDTDPRHHILQADGSLQTLHMDCCRDSGSCVEDTCHGLLTASGDLRKTDLLNWLKENA